MVCGMGRNKGSSIQIPAFCSTESRMRLYSVFTLSRHLKRSEGPSKHQMCDNARCQIHAPFRCVYFSFPHSLVFHPAQCETCLCLYPLLPMLPQKCLAECTRKSFRRAACYLGSIIVNMFGCSASANSWYHAALLKPGPMRWISRNASASSAAISVGEIQTSGPYLA